MRESENSTHFLRLLAWLLPCLIIAALFALSREPMLWPAILLLAVSAGITVAFLVRAYVTVAEIRVNEHWRRRTMIRLHIVLHTVPFAYLVTRQLSAPSMIADVLWLVAFAGFFYTGRHAWIGLFELYRSKLYYIFYRGNTGVLVMIPVLMIAGTLLQTPELIHRVLGIYFVIHFMLIGISVLKIERDIFTQR